MFDYVLARTFVRTAGSLSSYVIERQNSLFVRAKLWSALRYLRDAEIASYEREFLEIWRCQDLRLHLRLLLIEFLGEINSPVTFEMVCLGEVMQSEELRIASLKSIIGSPAWFANFARNEISSAMVGNDIEANQALRILQRACLYDAEEAVRLLRELWLPRPEKDSFTWAALDACTAWTEAVETIAHTILSRTTISPMQVDYTASVVAAEQPEVAFRLVRAKFDLLLEKALDTPAGKSFLMNGSHEEQVANQIADAPTKPFTEILEGSEWSSLPAMAEAEPQKFLEVLWSWFRAVFNELKDCIWKGVSEHVFPGLYSGNVNLGGDLSGCHARENPILSSLRLAVEGVANQNQAYFSNWAEVNGNLEFMVPQRLIAHGFCWAPETYAQKAFNWIFDDLRRLQLGDSHGHWRTTSELIKAVSPYWTDDQVRDFEYKMKKYLPKTPSNITEPKQLRSFNQFIRRTKAHLLAAIPLDRLSESSSELIVTEKRALGEDLDRGTRLIGSGFIGSPMESDAMAKAKDHDILKMFKEIPDNTDWDHPTDWMRGGNIQLSRAFAEFAKAEPVRAFRIMKQFDPYTQERAAGYALDSIAELSGHDRELQDALLDLHQRDFGVEEFRNSAAHAVEKITKRSTPIDESIIKVLIEWLSTPMKRAEASDEECAFEIIERDEEVRG